MEKKLRNWVLEEEAGQGMVEYALIIALIALVVYIAVSNVGNALVDFFNEAEQKISA